MATPSANMPRLFAAAVDRSIILLPTNGPRSLTHTVTLRPLGLLETYDLPVNCELENEEAS